MGACQFKPGNYFDTHPQSSGPAYQPRPAAVASVNHQGLRYSVLKGRGNYLCLNRWFRLLSGEIGNLSPRERTAVLPLIPWSQTTTTGDIEEQNQFNPKWFNKVWNLISAEHDCSGRRCPHYHSCFLQQAHSAALSSHIVIINHALFFINILRHFISRQIGPIVFDEAHHLRVQRYIATFVSKSTHIG